MTTDEQIEGRMMITDEQMLQILAAIDPETKRVPEGFKLFAQECYQLGQKDMYEHCKESYEQGRKDMYEAIAGVEEE